MEHPPDHQGEEQRALVVAPAAAHGVDELLLLLMVVAHLFLLHSACPTGYRVVLCKIRVAILSLSPASSLASTTVSGLLRRESRVVLVV